MLKEGEIKCMREIEQKYKSKQTVAWLGGVKGCLACIIAFVWHYENFPHDKGLPFYFHIFISMVGSLFQCFFCYLVLE